MDILEQAALNQQKVWKILEQSGIIPAWQKIGATVNLVGSLKSGLMMKNMDIDMHIYTSEVTISESFSVIREFAGNSAVREITYKNLIQTEEECIEWNAYYEDRCGNICKFDMIHIRRGSRYNGVVEHVTDAITAKLIPSLKRTILQIKNDIPGNLQIPGIEIYHAVFEGGVRNVEELQQWRHTHPLVNSLEWTP